MKALEILKHHISYLTNDGEYVKTVGVRQNYMNEAIAELEALQQVKSCKGCKDEHKDAYSLPCAACVRNCDSDYYEPKEQ